MVMDLYTIVTTGYKVKIELWPIKFRNELHSELIFGMPCSTCPKVSTGLIWDL